MQLPGDDGALVNQGQAPGVVFFRLQAQSQGQLVGHRLDQLLLPIIQCGANRRAAHQYAVVLLLANHGKAVTENWRLVRAGDRKSTRLNSSHVAISYAVFCLKKKNNWSS